MCNNPIFLTELLDKKLKWSDQLQIWHIIRIGINSDGLISLKIEHTKSRIIQRNNNIIYCAIYKGLKGLFRKGESCHSTEVFGRIICDAIKQELDNQGFFTSDELPSYGLSRSELRSIIRSTGAQKSDLVAIFAYDIIRARRTKELLDRLLLLYYDHFKENTS